MTEIRQLLVKEIGRLSGNYDIRGIVSRRGRVYPLGNDTKVLSTVFELVSRPAVYSVARRLKRAVVEPEFQNHYPDFTLMRQPDDSEKIAIDVKTTYRRKGQDKFQYTLGSYTSFIRLGNESKNIAFPFTEYARHLVIGFVYDRIESKNKRAPQRYTVRRLADVPRIFQNVDFFVNDKWRISGDRAGSGNTTNIGSIRGTIRDFRNGKGPFASEEEFLEYWRAYGRTRDARVDFSDIEGFRDFRRRGK